MIIAVLKATQRNVVRALSVSVILNIILYFEMKKGKIVGKPMTTILTPRQNRVTADRKNKYILLYTDYYSTSWPHTPLLGHEGFKRYGCPSSNCFLTQNKSLLGEDSLHKFDAIIFLFWPKNLLQKFNKTRHKETPDVTERALNLPDVSERRASQRYILYMWDPPTSTLRYGKLPLTRISNIFNWTMSYHLESDIICPYGLIHPAKENLTVDSVKWWRTPEQWISFKMDEFSRSLEQRPESFLKLANRPNNVAWIVSHCLTDSLREEYVWMLKQHIDVTVFGHCGRSCDWPEKGSCFETILQEYKFFLAFENTLCDHYISEKFWRTLRQPIIPIVMGRGFYHMKAPPRSFIDIDDFDSAEELAAYLHRLSNNRTEYLSYFWWKEEYKQTEGNPNLWLPMCKLCQMLNDKSLPSKTVGLSELQRLTKCSNPQKRNFNGRTKKIFTKWARFQTEDTLNT